MTDTPSTSGRTAWAQIGAVLAAIGASLCCVAPLVLLSIGVGGAWVSSLTALEPYRPIFIIATVALLGFTGWRLYRREDDCAPDEACANPAVKRRQRLIFWLVALPVLALLAFPWYAPALL
ncbi:mercuric transporter MerT family protein [Salinisphaera sp. P385]|uniref:Mercuric transport protein MerT n=1 Tax=Spectribacter acetivorans TaxID=3075603 RepID=A0ABU3B4V5_9GAMM|nr:mercuric transporter MerT family protein [Salinisphaera sp. P385]MDT0617486.1 mercuric transporter MerT family protein [Salinisphaera sp. P385]